MADFSNIKINGNSQQQQALKVIFMWNKAFCDPDAAKEIPNADYIFKNISKAGSLSKFDGRYEMELPDKFAEQDMVENGKTVCHELSHIDWGKNIIIYLIILLKRMNLILKVMKNLLLKSS